MRSVHVLNFTLMSPSSCQATTDQRISIVGTESPLTITYSQVFVPAALCPEKEQIFRGNQCTAPIHAMIFSVRKQGSSILFQRLNQDRVYAIFYLLSADINSQFHCNFIFLWELCGVSKCFNIKNLSLEVLDSISFGLLACALISLLYVHLVLCKFLFSAMQMLSLGTYTVFVLGQQDLILWRIFVSIIVLSGFAPIPFVLSLLFAF